LAFLDGDDNFVASSSFLKSSRRLIYIKNIPSNRIEQPLLSLTEFIEEFSLPKHEEKLKRLSLFSTEEAFWVHKVTATTKKK